MKRSKKFVISTIVASGLLVAATAIAHRTGHLGRHGGASHAEHMVEKVGDWLDLDSDQIAKLTVVAGQLQDLRNNLTANRSAMKEEVISMLDQPSLDQQRLIDIIIEKTQVINDSAPETIAALADFADGLDITQRDELMQMLNRRMGRHWDDD